MARLPAASAVAATPTTGRRSTVDRRLTDPTTIRALAHPLRLAMLRRLRASGPATATQLAAELGDTVPSTSYHLRQLARFGYVEEADDLGNRRDRWWRAIDAGDRVESGDLPSPELVAASAELAATGVRYAAGVAERHLDRLARGEVPADVMEATWLSNSGLHLTIDEATALGREFAALIDRFRPRIDPDQRPDDARLFHLSIALVPWDGR